MKIIMKHRRRKLGKKISLLSLNIGNPSLERAKKQCTWLEKRPEDVFILTETKQSKGCQYIKEFFLQYGYDLFSMNTKFRYSVNAPISKTGDLGVMIISKYMICSNYNVFPNDSIYFSRHAESMIEFGEKKLNLIGLYVPSRDRSDAKIQRKKGYINAVEKYIAESKKNNRIIMGDFNILERNHIPRYSNFFEWEYDFYDKLIKLGYLDAFHYCHPNLQEYSWVGRTKNGYRYDYCFVSSNLEKHILNCEYIHETRDTKLTDHSAILIELLY